MIRIPEKISIPFVSSFILIVLGLQTYASLTNTGSRGWPFIAYPMYRNAHHDGERIHHDFTLYAVLPGGERIEVQRDDLGLNFWLFYKHVFLPMRDGKREVLQPIANEYCRKHGRRIVGLVIEDKGVALSRDGMIEGLPPEVVASADVTCQ